MRALQAVGSATSSERTSRIGVAVSLVVTVQRKHDLELVAASYLSENLPSVGDVVQLYAPHSAATWHHITARVESVDPTVDPPYIGCVEI
jgi:hypothetical protein